MRKILSALLALIMLVSVVGCVNPGNNGGITINIMNTGGGIGRKWLDDAIVRYQKDNPHVKFNVEHNIDTGVGTMATSGYAIYFVEQGGIASLAASGKLLAITDILEEKSETRNGEAISILDKIGQKAEGMLKGYDGEYYAVPHFTIFSGMAYDHDLFVEKGFYLADYDLEPDGVNVKPFNSTFGSANFVGPDKPNVKKSVGNDGVSGTFDDGLPTTLVELCILCEKMKSAGTTPIEMNGKSNHYITNVKKALWAALDGGKSINAFFNYEGEVDYITGYDNSKTFIQGAPNTIPAITTEKATITEANGWKSTHTASNYYSTAFIQMMTERGWLSADYKSNTVTAGLAQLKFLSNGYNEGDATYGMLVEASHWYNEAEKNGWFKQYDNLSGEPGSGAAKDVRYFPMPTHLTERVTGLENARGNVMTQASDSYAFINANIITDVTLVQEVKKFFKFLYSDAELSHFTGETGVLRAHIDYDLLPEDEAKLSIYDQSIFQTYGASFVSLNVSEKQSYIRNASALIYKTVRPIYKGALYFSPLDPLASGAFTPEIYEGLRISQTEWENTYYVAN